MSFPGGGACCCSSLTLPFEIQTFLSLLVSFFCFFESSTRFHRLAILLVTSFLFTFLSDSSAAFPAGVTGLVPSRPTTAGLLGLWPLVKGLMGRPPAPTVRLPGREPGLMGRAEPPASRVTGEAGRGWVRYVADVLRLSMSELDGVLRGTPLPWSATFLRL